MVTTQKQETPEYSNNGHVATLRAEGQLAILPLYNGVRNGQGVCTCSDSRHGLLCAHVARLSLIVAEENLRQYNKLMTGRA